MVLFVNRDALGVRMTRPAPASFVLGAAQISLWLRVTFPSKTSLHLDSSKVCEQFTAGPELLFVIMNFIHKTPLLLWIQQRKLCILGLQSSELQLLCDICKKKSYNVNFRNWSNDGAFGNSWQCFGFRMSSRTRLFSTQKSNCSPSRRLHSVEFCNNSPAITRCWKKFFFTKLCELYLLFQDLEAQRASLHPVSRRLGRKRYQQFHFFWLHHCQSFIVHKNSNSSFFLLLSSRIDNTISQLLRWHWTGWQSELFGTIVLYL